MAPLLALAFAGIGLFTSISSTSVCHYFHVDVYSSSEDNDAAATVTLGIWRAAKEGESNSFLSCERYPSGYPIDVYLRTARAMSILAPIVCGAGMVLAFYAEIGFKAQQEFRKLVSILILIIAAVMQGLTLMVLESQVCIDNPMIPGTGSCGRSYGSNMSIGATSFMTLAVFLLFVKK